LSVMHPAPLEIICYHCQQAAEKFLKSVIVAFDEEVEKTHDLLKLLNTLEQIVEVSVDMRKLAVTLTQFATKTRYPDSVFIDEDITKRAITQAEQVKIWAEKIIAEKSDEQEEVNNN
ncbi:MAG: HEPN domain-containing protein, partial [Spirochaetales bacterium]|nr:HEPN domain-containing protein [Spirochaetales bacterium]